MRIRQMESKDLSDLVEISDLSKSEISAIMHSDRGNGLVLVRPTPNADVVNGYVLFKLFRGRCEIVDIGVRPLYRRQGYGTMLLQHVPGSTYKALVNEYCDSAISFFVENGFAGAGVDHRENGDFWVLRKGAK